MHLHEGVLKEEGLIALRQLLDLADGVFLQLAVAFGHFLDAVDLLDLRRLSALEAVIEAVARAGLAQHFQPLGIEHEIRIAALVDVLRQFLFGLVITIEFVEPDVLRTHALGFSHMPFAGQHGPVTRFAE